MPTATKKATRKSTPATSLVSKNLFQEVPCALCGNSTYSVVYPGKFPEELSEEFLKNVYRSSSDHGLFEQVVRCNLCNLVYLNPRLNPEVIIESYAEGEDESFIAQDAMRIRTFEKSLRQLANKHKIPLSKKTKILDIGCAGGAFLKAAHNLGLTTKGIEPNKWLSEYARKHYGLDVQAGVLSDFRFEDNSFDVITLWDVIEHVPNPEFELREIHRILKPGGLLVINYPDHVSLPARLLGRKWPFWLSVHLTYYTPETIKKHLNKCEFSVESIGPHWQTLELGYVLFRMTPYVPFAKSIKSLVEKVGLGHMPLTYWMGQTKVVSRKNK